jgi:hypothetical protein
MSQGLNLGANYTWSHTIDNQGYQGESGNNNLDYHNLNRWRGNSTLDRRHMLNLSFIYDLPFFKKSSGWLKNSLGNWQVSGITTFMTGTPLQIGCGVSGLHTGVGGTMYCNSTGKQSGQSTVTNGTYGPTVQWFNVDAFTQPNLDQLYADGQPGMFGYVGRNTVTAPGRNNWDLSLFKNFSFTERFGLQFRFETFNTWNHTQWHDVNTGCSGSVGPGETCGMASDFGQVSSAWSPRIIQLGLKFTF